MKRLRKEIEWLHAEDAVAVRRERAHVTRERRRIAGDVDHAPRPEPRDVTYGVGGARARRIEGDAIIAECPGGLPDE